jgi:hypothetical protein
VPLCFNASWDVRLLDGKRGTRVLDALLDRSRF